jgi:hypothetical protein
MKNGNSFVHEMLLITQQNVSSSFLIEKQSKLERLSLVSLNTIVYLVSSIIMKLKCYVMPTILQNASSSLPIEIQNKLEHLSLVSLNTIVYLVSSLGMKLNCFVMLNIAVNTTKCLFLTTD